MWINRFQQRLGKARELRVQLEMDSRGQPGEAFERTVPT